MTIIVNIPTARHIIKNTNSNRYWLKYFRKSYEQFTGVSVPSIGITPASLKKEYYTLDEQVERYSINLAYWYIQLKMDKTESNVKYSEGIEPKSVFIKSRIVELINIIKDYHPSLTSQVHQIAMDIKNNYLNNLNKA